MTVADMLALCEQGQCVMLEPRAQFDAAVRGVTLRAGRLCTVYSWDAVVDLFVSGGMTEDEATEWIAYNVEPAQCNGWPVLVSDE